MSQKFFLIRLVAGWFSLAAVTLPGMAATGSGHAAELLVSRRAHPHLLNLHQGHTTESFILANDAIIRIGSNTQAGLGELKLGEVAEVAYTVENGRWLAHEVEVKSLDGGHSASDSHSNLTNELHAHGEILAYNVSTGNLTIRYHR
jgi:hypothetical protein